MKARNKVTWAGTASLAWACAGFVALKLGCFRYDSQDLNFLLIFGAWWGTAFVLAAVGLRGQSSSGFLSALCIALLFTHFLWKMYPRVGLSHTGTARVTAAQTELAVFSTALDAFRHDNGFFPPGTDGLQALVRQPPGATNWHGPYLRDIPKDPWNHDYRYECPGRHNPDSYDLSSPGSPQAKVQIANWAK